MDHWNFDVIDGLSLSHLNICLTLLHPHFVTGDGLLCESNCTSIEPSTSPDVLSLSYRWTIDSRSYRAQAYLRQEGLGYSWELSLSPEDSGAWILLRSTEGSGELAGLADASGLRLFHGDNIRGVSQNEFLLNGTYTISMEEWKQPLNGGRWQCFPGWWIFDPASGVGIVSGVLQQDVWRHLTAKSEVTTSKLSWAGSMIPPGIDARHFAAGETYSSEPIYFELVNTLVPSQAFAGYLQALTKRLHPCKDQSILVDAAFWDSWNDRRPNFWDVSTDLVRRTIATLQAHFPTVRSLEIDDGYAYGGFHEIETDAWTNLEQGENPIARKTVQKVRRLGAGFAFEPDMALPVDRFPGGVNEAARLISDAGYTPAIWLGLNIVKEAAVVRAHPEWFVDYTRQPGDDAELSTVFSPEANNRFHIIDPSVPEAREYLLQVFDVLFQKWGFAAFKLDFWSYAFENDGFRLRHCDKTALEWRTWFFEAIRSYLPKRSYLVIGCDISTGNPFLSRWVDNVRYGIDIGNGEWNNIRYSALTGTFLLHVEAQRFYILNSDSIGVLPRLPDSEKQCFLAWCAVTRSLCEIAGDLSQKSANELSILKKLLLAPKNGAEVCFGEYDHLASNEPATILFAPGDLFSRTESSSFLPDGILAVFNWSDEVRDIEVNTEAFSMPTARSYLDVNFFTGVTYQRDSHRWIVTLPPRSVHLSHLSVVSDITPTVVESSWCIRKIQKNGESLEIELFGDSESGFQLHWPLSNQPYIETSSIPCTMSQGPSSTLHIKPNPTGSLQQWNLRVSPSS